MKHEIKYKHAAACAKVMSNAIGFCHSLLDNHVILNGDIKVAHSPVALRHCCFANMAKQSGIGGILHLVFFLRKYLIVNPTFNNLA